MSIRSLVIELNDKDDDIDNYYHFLRQKEDENFTSGLLAIPIFAGRCGYALSELFGWKEGLSKKFSQARPFYLIILFCIISGLIINYINPINPIQMLLYAATINGIILVPILVIIIKIGNDKKKLGNRVNRVNRLLSNSLEWTIIVIILFSVIIFIYLKLF